MKSEFTVSNLVFVTFSGARTKWGAYWFTFLTIMEVGIVKRILLAVVILGLSALTVQAQAGMNWRLVKDINTGSSLPTDTAQPEFLTDVNGVLYFAADDGVHGQELWKR